MAKATWSVPWFADYNRRNLYSVTNVAMPTATMSDNSTCGCPSSNEVVRLS